MNRIRLRVPAVVLALGVATVSPDPGAADGNGVQFPENYAEGVHYGTVERGGITEELYTSREAIRAAKNGEPFPSGTVILMEDHRGGELHRYGAMEKRTGWGDAYPASVRTGDCRFQEFNPDRTVKADVDETRCMSCHKPQKDQDYVFTVDKMKNVDLGNAGAE
jgi:hypothetical protein